MTCCSAQQKKAMTLEQMILPASLKLVLIKFRSTLYSFGLLMCSYLSLLLAALLDALNLISIVYLVIVFVCVMIHVLFRHAKQIIAKMWYAVVLIFGGILITRYFYQFPGTQ